MKYSCDLRGQGAIRGATLGMTLGKVRGLVIKKYGHSNLPYGVFRQQNLCVAMVFLPTLSNKVCWWRTPRRRQASRSYSVQLIQLEYVATYFLRNATNSNYHCHWLSRYALLPSSMRHSKL